MPESITPERKKRIHDVLSRRQQDLTLIMDNIWDPHNVSAVLRSCDAFGVLAVHLYYTTAEWPELGKKSSASAKKWVQRFRHSDPAEMIGGLRAKGFNVMRTGFSETARPLDAYDLSAPSAVILSNEHRGTSPELAELVPDEIYIPMQGMIQSFNVSVAAAIILYEASRQRGAKGMYDRTGLDAEEFEALEREWRER